jgi:Helix-turn-helix domain
MSVDELADRGAVFEIGRTLREARTRLGLDLAEVERRTRIQARFLVALEEERFELLPGDAYARGFLRSYAEALGLDGQLFLDEYKARFGERAQSALAPPRQVERMRRPALPALVLASVVLAIAGLAGLLSSACGTAARSSATRARPGEGKPTPARAGPTAVEAACGASVAGSAADIGAWDPDGDGHEHHDEAGLATDGDPATYWRTETYADGLKKPGLGLLLDAGAPVRPSHLSRSTDTPGCRALIEAGTAVGGPFTAISRPLTVAPPAPSPSTEAGRATTSSGSRGFDHLAHVNEVRATRLGARPRCALAATR